MTRQWTVKVDGNNVKTLHDGESVEIGRKPLRPLSDDGFARLDIMDPGKSMSKRHAVLSVDKQGNCSVRDLHSTNGSFVVTNNGQLMRLPAGEDIKLPIDSMTLQFGDVRLTLESAFEHDDEDDDATSGVSDDTSQPVSNLFEYAVSDEAPQEPDAADMSVDDILNLRAGEPTTFFHARNVTDRADALHQAERQTFTPEMHRSWLATKVATGQVVQYIILDNADGKPVGSVYYRDIDNHNRSAEYGIFIGEESARGKGLGTETARLFTDFGFAGLHLHRIRRRNLQRKIVQDRIAERL